MRDKTINIPITTSEKEQKTPIHTRLGNGHWRLQKALDFLLNYLMELEMNNQGDQEDTKNATPLTAFPTEHPGQTS